MICAETKTMIAEDIEPHLGEAKDIQHFFHILSLRIFGKISLSFDFGAPENSEYAEWLNEMVKFGSSVIGNSIVLNIPTTSLRPSVRTLASALKRADGKTNELIDARLEAMRRGEDTPDDMLAAMLAEQMPRDLICDQIRTLLSAGHDTSAFTGCYMAYVLAQHQSVQDKVKVDVVRVLQGRTEVTAQDIAELKYCRMVVQETLRLYTVIPMISRTNSKDHTLKGSDTTIPQGTKILIPLTIMSRDEEIFEEPNSFKPERFEEITSHSSAKHGYLPFGYGSRTCIGNTLALTESVVMLALLMQKYRLFPEPSFKAQVVSGISLVSANGIVVKVERDEFSAGPQGK